MSHGSLTERGRRQILYMNTCDKKQIWTTDDCFDQEWPQLIVQNLTFEDGYSAVERHRRRSMAAALSTPRAASSRWSTPGSSVIAVTRAAQTSAVRRSARLAQWRNRPVYLTSDTFRGGVCSNGGALSSIDVNWDVFNSLMINNRAIGLGPTRPRPERPGGGSGGAIYTDGDDYNVLIAGTVIRHNSAREAAALCSSWWTTTRAH